MTTILPDSAVEWIRRALMRPYHLPYVVVRESAVRRFVNRKILRLYYPPSMVSRQSRLRQWVDTRVLGRKPRLFHFEIHMTDHCNLNCKGCGHFSNLSEPSFVQIDSFDRDLGAMAALFDPEQIYLMGGEALLHPNVPDLVRIARGHFPNTHLCLMSNGLLVTRMGEEFWQALAETRTVLICASYPIKLPVEEIDSLATKYRVTLEWTHPRTEFFRIPIDLDGQQDPDLAFRRCDGVGNCPIVRNGRLYPCAYAAYSDLLMKKFDLSGLEAEAEDSIDIHAHPDPVAAIRFMRHSIPWCRNCDFDGFSLYEWGRSERSLDEWVCSPVSQGGQADA